MDYLGYENLANAIVTSAIMDYRIALSKHDKAKQESLLKWFDSEYCKILTNVNMVDVANKIRREEYEKRL